MVLACMHFVFNLRTRDPKKLFFQHLYMMQRKHLQKLNTSLDRNEAFKERAAFTERERLAFFRKGAFVGRERL